MNITELEEYYKTIMLPETIELGQGIKIKNVSNFAESHLTVIKHYPNVKSFHGFYERLIKLKVILEQI